MGVRGNPPGTPPHAREQAAINYANSFSYPSISIQNTTPSATIKNDKIKIGPFKVNYSGTKITISQISDQNGNKISNTSHDEIKSGESFYIYIPTNVSCTSINFKLNSSMSVEGAKLWFFKALNNKKQNMMVATPTNTEFKSGDANFSFNLAGNIEIPKVDSRSRRCSSKRNLQGGKSK